MSDRPDRTSRAARAAQAAMMATLAVVFSVGRPAPAMATPTPAPSPLASEPGAPGLPGPLKIPDQPAAVAPGAGWTEIPAPRVVDAPAMVLRHDRGAVLAVTVAMAPNGDAWRDKARAAYVDEVVAGFAAEPGVKVARKTVHKVRGVPTVDLWLERKAGDRTHGTAVRLLLFRTRTIAAAAEGASRASLEAAVRSLEPTISVTP